MTISRAVRVCLLAPLAAVAFTGCNSNQAQLLALRDECQRQLQAKDKTIEEQSQKLADVRAQMDQLQLQAAKSSVDPDKLAATITEAVAKQLAQQDRAIADLKRSVDQLAQSGALAQTARPGPGPGPASEAPPPVKMTPKISTPKETTSSSSEHPGAIKEKFEFPK